MEIVFLAILLVLLAGLLFALDDMVWEVLFHWNRNELVQKPQEEGVTENHSTALISTTNTASVLDARRALWEQPDAKYFLFLKTGDVLHLGSQSLPQSSFLQLRLAPPSKSPWWTFEEQWERERESVFRSRFFLPPLCEDRGYLVERATLEKSVREGLPPALAWQCSQDYAPIPQAYGQGRTWVQPQSLSFSDSRMRREELNALDGIRLQRERRSNTIAKWLHWRGYRQLLIYRVQQASLLLLLAAGIFGTPQEHLNIPPEIIFLSQANSLFLVRRAFMRSLVLNRINLFPILFRFWAGQYGSWLALSSSAKRKKYELFPKKDSHGTLPLR